MHFEKKISSQLSLSKYQLKSVNKKNTNFSFRKTAPKAVSQLKRDFDAKYRSEAYRSRFRLPLTERLDGEVVCHLWTPHNRSSISGKLYISMNFICFASKVRFEKKLN